jgi:hypothetical protein
VSEDLEARIDERERHLTDHSSGHGTGALDQCDAGDLGGIGHRELDEGKGAGGSDAAGVALAADANGSHNTSTQEESRVPR